MQRLTIQRTFDQSFGTVPEWLDVVKGAFDGIVKEDSAHLIHKVAPAVGTVPTIKGKPAALDIDVSPFENSKTKKERLYPIR